ncbi:hypothetical protein [Casimicrobium huifangae]|uniref:hypothetical protein n=1 Tax=Casimicrobium huifangae TaxID=2591109 RepID=UPI0037838D4B
MTLTADQLEEIIDGTASDDPDAEMKAIDAARRDLAAMRQPITDEALTAAGWVESGRPTIRRDGVVIFRNKACSGVAAVAVFCGGQIVGDFEIEAAGFQCKNVTNMYALGQLVELLGGGA